MLTKPLLLIILAACAAPSGAAVTSTQPEPDPPEFAPPPEPPQEDQHFCCQHVDPKTMSGDGCLTIGKGQVDQCPELLYCSGSYAKHDGKVYCD